VSEATNPLPAVPVEDIAIGDTWVGVTGSGRRWEREITEVDRWSNVYGMVIVRYGAATSTVWPGSTVPVIVNH
jgi:hypothetical protein